MQTRRGIILHWLFILLLGAETWQNPISQLIQNQATTSCGQSQPISQGTTARRRGKRIVGGQASQYGKWPWVVTLFVNNSHYCSGSIVKEKWIVTTSHCFHNSTSLHAKDWVVKVGKFNLKKKELYEQTSTVKQIIRHPNYTSLWDLYQIDEPDDHDVALLELNTPIHYTTHVRPICLQDDSTRVFLPGDTCFIAGWGHTKFGGGHVQDELNDVSMKLVPRAVCNSPQSYNGSVHARAICAGYKEGGRDACQYDSGGPLFCDNAGRWYLVGQVSWGDECGLPHKYGVYSDMKVLSPWVVQTIAKN